jgi:hypothetical protein
VQTAPQIGSREQPLTASCKGVHLCALLQSALVQDSGLEKTTDRHTRLVNYNVGLSSKPPKTLGNMSFLYRSTPTYPLPPPWLSRELELKGMMGERTAE